MTRVLTTVTCSGSSASSDRTGCAARCCAVFRLRKKESKIVMRLPEACKSGHAGGEVHLVADSEVKNVIGTHRHGTSGTLLERISFACKTRHLSLKLKRTGREAEDTPVGCIQ